MTADEYVEHTRFFAHMKLKRCSDELAFGLAVGDTLKSAFEAGFAESRRRNAGEH